MDVTATLNQAIVAAKAGRKAEARRLLETVLDADERNEQAWFWLSGVVEDDKERIICLENVLTINPNHEMARKGLATIEAETASSSQPVGVSASPPGHSTVTVESGGEVPPSPAPEPVSRTEASDSDSLPDRPHLADNRAFIVITIILALMLICIVVSIITFTMLTPPG